MNNESKNNENKKDNKRIEDLNLISGIDINKLKDNKLIFGIFTLLALSAQVAALLSDINEKTKTLELKDLLIFMAIILVVVIWFHVKLLFKTETEKIIRKSREVYDKDISERDNKIQALEENNKNRKYCIQLAHDTICQKECVFNSVLSFGATDFFKVTIPSYNLREYTENTNLNQFIKINDDWNLCKETSLKTNVIKQLEISDKKYMSSRNDVFKCNEIHIGGPIANINTAIYLEEIFGKYNKVFKQVVSPNYMDSINYKQIKNTINIFEETTNQTIPTLFRITNSQNANVNFSREFILTENENYIEDYAFIVRYRKNNMTIFLLFGMDLLGTKRAVEFFLQKHSQLLENVINQSNENDNFCIAIRVRKYINPQAHNDITEPNYINLLI